MDTCRIVYGLMSMACASGRVRAFYLAPTPPGHRSILVCGRARLRIDNGESGSPFEITDESGAKFRILRNAQFVSRVEQQRHPGTALRLVQMPVQVLSHS